MTEVVSSIVTPLVEKLASLAVEEIQLARGGKDDREKLRSTLEMIQAVLAHAEQRQAKEAAVRLWLSSLKDFCYDTEDVLDEFEARKVRYLFSWMPNFIFQFKMAHKMKKLIKTLDGINERKAHFNLSSNVYEKTIIPQRETPQRETYSFVSLSNVIGRKEEKESIIELLIRSDDDGVGTMAVLPIIGMGGTGKTTLAKLVYDDDRINKHFKDNKVWISMLVEFEVKKIIRDIIESLDHDKKCDKDTIESIDHEENELQMLQDHIRRITVNKCDRLEVLQDRLRSIVKNKRCLFVMDDVWEMGRKDWMELRDLLEGVSEGSKVIMTSRNQSIAEIMGTVPPLNLANLSREDCLTLFVKHAFDRGQEKNHPELMVIGKDIVSKCGGNPLAVKTLGSLLYSKKNNRSDWEYVRDSEIWQLKTDILPSLRISYDLMPSYLKRCFMYCSIFPKNHVFSNLDLIQLWISNGLIQSNGNNQELEEIGRQYLEELWSRSFFDVVYKDYPVLFFRMHDLIHELAILVAQTESSNMKVQVKDISSMTRHILFPNPSHVAEEELRSCLSKLSRVHSIMFEEGSAGEVFLEMCISRFKHLRVLWLDGSRFELLPNSIGGLKHLRFLTLRSNHYIKELPKSVCKLRNLLYLGLGGCTRLKELPANIKNMISLRVLSITTKQQRFAESGIGCLTSLQWLFIGECENLEALFDDIQLLTSLRKLFIWGCPKLASLPEGIKNLKALKDLGIWGCESLKLPESESNEPRSMLRLQSLRFEKLPEIVCLPGWLEGSASTLQTIRIADCPNLKVLPQCLQNCSSLRKVEIKNCPGLSSLPDGIRSIAKLTELQIINCGGIEQEIAVEEENCE